MIATILSVMTKDKDILMVKTFQKKNVSATLMYYKECVLVHTNLQELPSKLSNKRAEALEATWRDKGAVMEVYSNNPLIQ